MSRETVVKGKLVMKDLGNPKRAAALEDGDETSIFLGTIVGMAVGISTRTNDTGEVFEGLKGEFRGIPADENKPIVESGILYLHPGMFERVAVQFRGDNPARQVGFALEIYTKKANNKAGYEYAFRPIREAEAVDPLAPLMEMVAAAQPAQIEDKRKNKKEKAA